MHEVSVPLPAEPPQQRSPVEDSGGGPANPPLLLFLPGLSTLGHNTTVRLADVMCANLTRGRGTYAVRSLDSDAASLSDGRRIVGED